MIIKNAEIYTPDHSFVKGDLVIRGEKISFSPGCDAPFYSGAPLPGENIIDAEGLLALPGLVDIHFHGAAGHDFCEEDPESLRAIARYEAANGVLAICPATMTFPESKLNAVMDNAASYRYSADNAKDAGTAADLVGINLEGPFISSDKAGAQNPDYIIAPDTALFRRFQARSGRLIRLCSVAPEMPGALEFIRAMHEEVRISLAHTGTDYDTAKKAFEEGARHITHLFNAMPGINHREPGPIIAALEAGADVELIADGVHIHPAVVRFAFRLFGAEHMILISDSMEATGLPDGNYTLGGQDVTVSGRRASLKDAPAVIAGSVTNLYDCMKTAVREMGVPLTDAVRAASENPARAIGLGGLYGTLAPGAYANIILADHSLERQTVILRGRRID